MSDMDLQLRKVDIDFSDAKIHWNPAGPEAGVGSVASLSIAHRNAARVLPDPVGAMTRACSPLPIASHAPA